MHNLFAIRTLMFRAGERFPVLVTAETGEPDFDTTVYVLTQLRATGKASNTITHHLRAIVVLKLYLFSREIELGERIRSSQVFQPHELDELVRYCKRPLPEILSDLETNYVSDPLRNGIFGSGRFRPIADGRVSQ